MATEVTTEVKRKRPINRLQTFYPLRALFDEMYKAARESQKEDRPVVWAMADHLIHPILNVMDVETIYPENYATQCATTRAIVPYLDRSVAEGFPSYVCGYLQNTIGYTVRMFNELGGEIPPEAPRGGMPKPDLLITYAGGCTAHCKPFQVSLGRYLNTPIWCTEPKRAGYGGGKEKLMEGAYERDVQFQVKRYRKFIVFLERLFGKKFDWDKLGEHVTQRIEMGRVLYDICELRQARPNPMHARDYFGAMSAYTFGTSDYQKAKELYQDMYNEVKYRVDNKISGINQEEKYRVAFNGLGPWHSMNIFDNLAERGWNFPREGYHYHPPVPVEASVTDPLERLIRDFEPDPSKVIDWDFGPEEGADVKAEIRQNGYSPRLTGKEARHFNCDGVLLWSSLGCHAGGATQFLYPINLMKAYKIPCLTIETDQCDPRLFDMDDFMHKAEAFEETMDHYKEVRKKEGLD